MFWTIFLLATSLKALFIPAYFSTDFEVHRNWLAITNSLPISQWYYEKTSEWTLDYPPVFAYFEYALSRIASLADSRMVDVENLGYASNQTVLFQRSSVILADVIYALGVKSCIEAIVSKKLRQNLSITLLLFNVGLFIVDHIHFQYNGMLYGIMLLSISSVIQDRYLVSAFLFALLLNMKHIFVYMAPVYVVYLFKNYCWEPRSFRNLVKIGAVVIGVTLIAFAPFLGHLPQVLSQLFPFKRGLSHAYWAPNFWAVYNFGDIVLRILMGQKGTSSSTGGLVQAVEHTVLPNISPKLTFLLTFLAMCPSIACLAFDKSDRSQRKINFIRALSLCAGASFLFGWHVHEKAVLMILIPISLIACINEMEGKMMFFITTVGHFSLLPLLFNGNLVVPKILLFFVGTLLNYGILKTIHPKISLSLFEKIYMKGLIGIIVYEQIFHRALKLDRTLPFLPLMLTSVYCSLGIIYFWTKHSFYFIKQCQK